MADIQVITDPLKVARPLRPDKVSLVGNPIYYGIESNRYLQVPPIANVWTATFTAPPAYGTFVVIAGYAFFFVDNATYDPLNPFQIDVDAPNSNVQLAIKLRNAINTNANTLDYFVASAAGAIVTITGTPGISLAPTSNAGAALVLSASNAPGPAIYRENYRLNLDVYLDPDYLSNFPRKRLRRLTIPGRKDNLTYTPFYFELQDVIKPELEFDIQDPAVDVVTFANRAFRSAQIRFFESFGLNSTCGVTLFDLVGGLPYTFYVLNGTHSLYESLLHTTTSGSCPDSILDFDNLLEPYFEGDSHKFLTASVLRQTFVGATEYLCWYYPSTVTTNLRLVAEVTYTDGTQAKLISSFALFDDYIHCDPPISPPTPLPSDRILVIPVHRLWSEFDFSRVKQFDVFLTDNVGLKRYSNLVTYFMNRRCRTWNTFFFSNRFGMPDTFHVDGEPERVLNVARTETQAKMSRLTVYNAEPFERKTYDNASFQTYKQKRKLESYEKELARDVFVSTDVFRVAQGACSACCVVTDGCADQVYKGTVSQDLTIRIGELCGDVVVAYFPNASLFDPSNWDAFTLLHNGGIVASVPAGAFPGIMTLPYAASPTDDDFMLVKVIAGANPTNTWALMVLCPDNTAGSGAFSGVLQPPFGYARKHYTGTTPGTVTIPFTLGFPTAVFAYWNGVLVDLQPGPTGTISFPYAWTSGDDEYIVILFANPSSAVPMSWSYDVIPPAYARKPKNPCRNLTLLPIVLTDKSYVLDKSGNEADEIEFQYEESRALTINTR